MAWLSLCAEGDGVGVDQDPGTVAEILAQTVDTMVELSDRGAPVFVDRERIWYIEADNEERENKQNAAAAVAEEEEPVHAG
jgi:hypothetical protein